MRSWDFSQVRKMTNREFWKRLNDISMQPVSADRELQFATVLKQGYEEDRGILISCFYDRGLPGMAKQSYIEMGGDRYLVCYTSKKNARNARQGEDWNIASTRDILNNFFNKNVIAGLFFNPGHENMILIIKPLLEMIMPGEKEKPPFYREPN